MEHRGLSLLDYIALKAGCMYLSDLHYISPQYIRHIVREIDPSRFCLQEWNNTVEYITGNRTSFEDENEAAALPAELRNKGQMRAQ